MCCLRRIGEGYHPTTFEDVIARGVGDAVRHEAESRVDVMSDGATYIRHRITGFEPKEVPRATPQDLDEYPEFRDRLVKIGASPKYLRPI
jgi:5-methyltetrahydropteroyltriglutamate--homocysteine methyltransferase